VQRVDEHLPSPAWRLVVEVVVEAGLHSPSVGYFSAVVISSPKLPKPTVSRTRRHRSFLNESRNGAILEEVG
jgi:hypothetical protein